MLFYSFKKMYTYIYVVYRSEEVGCRYVTQLHIAYCLGMIRNLFNIKFCLYIGVDRFIFIVQVIAILYRNKKTAYVTKYTK